MDGWAGDGAASHQSLEITREELITPRGRENHRISFIYLLSDKVLPRRLWMVILCNYILGEVLQAPRHVNLLVLTAHLGGRCMCGEGVVLRFTSQFWETEALFWFLTRGEQS